MRLMFLIALLLPLPASAFIAKNGMYATQISPTEIMVGHEVRRNETDYWCAAGDFAKRVLDQPGKARIWRASSEPRGAGEGIIFTLDPAKKAEGSGISQFGSGPRDGSISLSMASNNFCRPRFPFYRDLTRLNPATSPRLHLYPSQ